MPYPYNTKTINAKTTIMVGYEFHALPPNTAIAVQSEGETYGAVTLLQTAGSLPTGTQGILNRGSYHAAPKVATAAAPAAVTAAGYRTTTKDRVTKLMIGYVFHSLPPKTPIDVLKEGAKYSTVDLVNAAGDLTADAVGIMEKADYITIP